nr:hypothetical protein [Tanacetum cinerariifolium]
VIEKLEMLHGNLEAVEGARMLMRMQKHDLEKVCYEDEGRLTREVDNDLKFEKKFRELCEEVTTTVKEKGKVIEKLEMLHGNLEAVEGARMLMRMQKNDLEKVCYEDEGRLT